MEQLSMMPPTSESEAKDLERRVMAVKERAKQKRKWENSFQRWSNEISQDGTTPLGCCGFGGICDYCENNDVGRPCVRALNAKAREMKISIDYNDTDFAKWFYL